MNEIVIKQIEVRVIECGIHRVLACIDKLTNEQLQYRPNANLNSINNQILHLDGNVRQWLIASLSCENDTRKRDDEFDPNNQISKEELIEILTKLEKDVRALFPLIQNMNLADMKHVQCYYESVLSIIVHVIEHFSYHLGQITYITKMLLDIDTGYYAGLDLNEMN